MEKNPQFRPSDTDLIMQLLKFVAGKCLPTEELIGFAYVYSNEPWQLIGGMSSKKTHYLFTQLKKKKPTDARFNRTTGNGTWTQQNKGKKILDEDDSLIIGYKISLTYKHKKDSSLNGRWLMMECFLADYLLRELKSDEAKEFVICAIKKNPRSEIRGNSIASIVEYKRFIDRVLQEGVHLQTPSEQSTMILSKLESTSSDVFSMGQLESKDGMLVIINQTDSDEFFGMVNVENQEWYYQEGDEEEVDWESILDFGDHGSVQNDLLY